jgi:hypothetical protein
MASVSTHGNQEKPPHLPPLGKQVYFWFESAIWRGITQDFHYTQYLTFFPVWHFVEHRAGNGMRKQEMFFGCLEILCLQTPFFILYWLESNLSNSDGGCWLGKRFSVAEQNYTVSNSGEWIHFAYFYIFLLLSICCCQMLLLVEQNP